MEDVSKDQLKDLQNFFKQRNKQNEGINSQVIDHIGKLLSEIDGSKLNEVDKIQNNKIVNALGHFIAKCNPIWTIKSQVLNGKNFVLKQPKSKLSVLDTETFKDLETLQSVISKEIDASKLIVILESSSASIDAEQLNSLSVSKQASAWLFNIESGLIKQLNNKP